MAPASNQELIVTIIKKGYAEQVIEASRKAGAEGATIMFGRGTGIHEQKKLLGIPIEPEKEIIFTVVPAEISEKVLAAIIKAGKLERPATGIAFVLELKMVVGVAHLLREQA
ncbi:MAG TPA: P-II family nitrogen regulator [Bacillota bacterium]|jgi:nitrogen regulatory protein PII|nr:P-II family nitrogen regulator [Bacillota bacterium]HPZ41786.1 P-II family nitrogen regulator [Bacillota bacterium]HQD52655.1 P-II family nitrogen regulator [Bacillota bacterium]